MKFLTIFESQEVLSELTRKQVWAAVTNISFVNSKRDYVYGANTTFISVRNGARKMLIDQSTGKIEFDNGLIISPFLTLNEFEKSPFCKKAKRLNGEYTSDFFLIFEEKDRTHLDVRLLFSKGFLYRASIRTLFENEDLSKTQDGPLSDVTELRRKEVHDKLLISMFGDDQLDQPWGELRSRFNEETRSSYISIDYKRRQANADVKQQ